MASDAKAPAKEILEPVDPAIFDPTPYVRRPITDVATAVGLAVQLLRLLPEGAPADVKRRARELRGATAALQKAWGEALECRPEDRRPADLEVDRAWGALHERLEAYGNLPVAAFPRAARAGELMEILFPSGLSFLQLPYEAEWTESDMRLSLIGQHGLEADLADVCGADFVAYLRSAHEQYGRALGTAAALELDTERRPETAEAGEAGEAVTPVAPDPAMAEPLRRVSTAVSRYALQVAATVDEGHPETARAARRALAPLEEHRGRGGSGGGAGRRGEERLVVSPVTPLPEVH